MVISFFGHLEIEGVTVESDFLEGSQNIRFDDAVVSVEENFHPRLLSCDLDIVL